MITTGLDPDEAQRRAKRMRCSDCYGVLVVKYDGKTRTASVECSTPGCEHRGEVSAKTVEIRRAENVGEYLEARQALRVFFPNSENNIMKELFG